MINKATKYTYLGMNLKPFIDQIDSKILVNYQNHYCLNPSERERMIYDFLIECYVFCHLYILQFVNLTI